MNVAYDKFSSQDVAKILGVAPQPVTCWVRKGYMASTNVSDGNEKARYLFTDEEVTRVQELMKQYGKFSWARHSHDLGGVIVSQLDEVPTIKEVPVTENEFTDNHLTSTDVDKLMNKILRLQELKEECDNVKARYNQLCKEITMLREEIIGKL